MKESEVYLNFLKRNLWLFILPLIFTFGIAIYLYSQVPAQTKIVQSFKLEYSLENVDQVIALTDQAVVELRIQRFAALFPNATAAVYKNAPLTITIETLADNKEVSYQLLIKESEYLRQNFAVSEVTSPEISIVEPNLFKYLISALILGGLLGLVISLTKEYLRNY